ncbi:SO_0444 family Cu/Zn efflux transporter [Magnetovibrio sp.]|uniref:SO_0444 family Cu/Zn efflux transporter n=1 Tax=Magnetovibrio sp. TaxID=2024836 RepID=UPI002F92814E
MINEVQAIFMAILDMYLDAAPWLIVGIVAAGLVHALMPDGLLGKWLGGNGTWSVVKAALLGAPLPLCSCGVLPAAVSLRKEGASKGATVSFLIATPETGPDSVAISYALLGPIMAVARPIAAILSAIFSGLLANLFVAGETQSAPMKTEASTCTSCCGDHCSVEPPVGSGGLTARTWGGVRYGFTDILDDIALWLAIGLVVAGVMSALVEPQALSAYGHGIGAMVVMLVVGVPIYVCATASTPIAAGLIAVGVSPGAALVFLLAGPATNIATLGVVGKDLGVRALVGYLLGISISAIASGLALDAVLSAANIDIHVQMAAANETLPQWLVVTSGVLLAPFFLVSLIGDVKKRLKR